MKVHTLTLGPLATNCYLVWKDVGRALPEPQRALLIDCAGDPQDILTALRERKLDICLVVNTHGHSDHIESLARLKELTGAQLAIHELDIPMLSDAMLSGAAMFGFSQHDITAERLLKEGDAIALPGTDSLLSVLHTPGHTPGSLCLLGDCMLFSGDCLFAGGIGRVDLPGGDERAMMRSLARLAQLDPHTVVYPGHGPTTTIGDELDRNPWLTNV